MRIGRGQDRPGRRSAIRRLARVGQPDAGPDLAELASAPSFEPTAYDPAEPLAARPRGGEIRPSSAKMLAFARETYNIRRRRARFLPMDLFGEPTWDILLDLYVATRENRPVPTTSACIGANVPPTTALRWLRILEARGLVDREEDGRDGRRTFVRLSELGLTAMEDWIQAALVAYESVTAGRYIDIVPLAEAAE